MLPVEGNPEKKGSKRDERCSGTSCQNRGAYWRREVIPRPQRLTEVGLGALLS